MVADTNIIEIVLSHNVFIWITLLNVINVINIYLKIPSYYYCTLDPCGFFPENVSIIFLIRIFVLLCRRCARSSMRRKKKGEKSSTRKRQTKFYHRRYS